MYMLERWRRRTDKDNKDKQHYEDIDTNSYQKNFSQQHKLQTKVTYQYPKKAPFRFPLIPDKTDHLDTMDIPAYKRKRRTDRYEHINNDRIEKPKPAENQSNEKIKQPFKPTEVASPIYGYQKRNRVSESVEQIPAFVRKREKKELMEQPIVNHEPLHKIENETTEQVHTSQKEFIKETPNQIDDAVEKIEQCDIKETVQRQTIDEKQRSQKPLVKNNVNKKVHKNSGQKREKTNNAKQIQPFNVVMTPRDKYNLRKRASHPIKNEPTKLDTEREAPLNYAIPYHLLNVPSRASNEDKAWVKQQQLLLEKTLKYFNVQANVVNATQGPSVTRFEVQPALGVKVSRIRNLNDDIKLNMSAKDIRIEAPIPGKNTVGIEIPNLNSQTVGLREVFTTPTFQKSKSKLTIGLGLDVEGVPLVTDIAKMPHGLIAGATGSGKSVCINTILISLLYKSHYDDVKFLLIDPKMVELAPYNGIPHLVSPVITDIKAATAALQWAVEEMESRYEKFVQAGVRDIGRYNEKMLKTGRPKEKLPLIVIVIDELADLMMISPQDVEDAICRIAQKARACGMHLLLATQRPSVDVITGLIKANIPTRIAFSVSSQVDSRTIIDMNGAERLLGKGDMLFIENGSGKSHRLQGAFVSDEEIEKVTDYARKLAKPQYLFEQEQLLQQIETDEEKDPIFDEVIQFILKQNNVSTSLLQRQFRIGYNRAARLIDTLENSGMISGQNGSKPRDVLLSNKNIDASLQTD